MQEKKGGDALKEAGSNAPIASSPLAGEKRGQGDDIVELVEDDQPAAAPPAKRARVEEAGPVSGTGGAQDEDVIELD